MWRLCSLFCRFLMVMMDFDKVGVCICLAIYIDDWCLNLMFGYVVIG